MTDRYQTILNYPEGVSDADFDEVNEDKQKQADEQADRDYDAQKAMR